MLYILSIIEKGREIVLRHVKHYAVIVEPNFGEYCHHRVHKS
jgi:hypothetical protein